MALPSVNAVVEMLQNAQIRAIQGYPGREMPQLQQPAVAVNMKLYDTAGRLLTVVAEIRSPAEKHGWACEDLATSVAQILAVQGAACRQGKCQYDSKTGQFYAQVEATWHEPVLVEEMVASMPFRVYLNGNRLEYAVGFTAEQTIELEKVGAIGEVQAAHLLSRNTGWVITLEELFPKHALGMAEMEQPAQLQILRSDGAETYIGCIWTKLQRKETMDGVKQVRTGWAETREVYVGG